MYAMHAIYSVRDARAVCGSGYSSLQSGVCGQRYGCVGKDRGELVGMAYVEFNHNTHSARKYTEAPQMWVCLAKSCVCVCVFAVSRIHCYLYVVYTEKQ